MSCTCAMSVGVDYVPGLVMSSSTVGYNVRKLLLDLGAGRNSTPIVILQQNFNCKSSNRQHILSRQLCGRFFEQRQLQLSNGRYTLKVYKQATLAEKNPPPEFISISSKSMIRATHSRLARLYPVVLPHTKVWHPHQHRCGFKYHANLPRLNAN